MGWRNLFDRALFSLRLVEIANYGFKETALVLGIIDVRFLSYRLDILVLLWLFFNKLFDLFCIFEFLLSCWLCYFSILFLLHSPKNTRYRRGIFICFTASIPRPPRRFILFQFITLHLFIFLLLDFLLVLLLKSIVNFFRWIL